MGLDWAKQEHAIVVVDREGRIRVDTSIEHTAEGWHRLREKLVALAGPDLSLVATTIETNRGPAVERLRNFAHKMFTNAQGTALTGFRDS